MMFFCDTHTHLYLPEFDEDRDAMLQRSFEAGVTHLYLPNIDRSSIDSLHMLAAAYPENCFPMMGLHPCSVKPDTWQEELKEIETLLFSGAYCAVGEIGIDLYWDTTTFVLQQEAFRIQCEWALRKKLPVSIHSRNATQECIDLVKPFAGKGLTGVFHCFSGTDQEAAAIVAMGFYLGIGGVLTFKKSMLPEAIAGISSDRLVLETDSPYLAPVPYRGKRNESAYIRLVAAHLADINNASLEEIAAITTSTAQRIFHHEP